MASFILDGRTEGWLYLLCGGGISYFWRSLFRFSADSNSMVLYIVVFKLGTFMLFLAGHLIPRLEADPRTCVKSNNPKKRGWLLLGSQLSNVIFGVLFSCRLVFFFFSP